MAEIILLYGTGNEAKLASMERCLAPLSIELLGLQDMKTVAPNVPETGDTPLENARQKAMAYYKAFQIPVFSCDSGLYFENVPDEIQPGIHVRNIAGKKLTDEEMISYYAKLANKYGDLVAKYKNAICFVKDAEHIYESMDDSLSGERFIITKTPHAKRVFGFPLDSLSKHIKSGNYYYDIGDLRSDEATIDNGFRKFFRENLLMEH